MSTAQSIFKSQSSSSTSKHPDVLIIGGGIAGQATALFLRKAGLAAERIHVYEAYHSTSTGIGGGLNLAPNGMRVLAALGLDECFAKGGVVTPLSIIKNQKGGVIGTMPYGNREMFGQVAVNASRALLYEVLSQAMHQQGIQVQYSKKLARIEDSPDSSGNIVAHFEDGTNAVGDILIGADGVNSAVRSSILPDGPKPEPVGIVGMGGFTKIDTLPAGVLKEDVKNAIVFTMGCNFFGHGGSAPGEYMWWTNLSRQPYTKEELDMSTPESVERDRKELIEMFGQYYEPIPSLIKNAYLIKRVNIFDVQRLPRWHKGRVILIGDAAHAVSPNSGQGASMALEDAMLLAKLFKNLLVKSESSDLIQLADVTGIFTEFERARKDRVEDIVLEGRRRAIGKATASPFGASIRNAFAWLFLRLAPSMFIKKDWFCYEIKWD